MTSQGRRPEPAGYKSGLQCWRDFAAKVDSPWDSAKQSAPRLTDLGALVPNATGIERRWRTMSSTLPEPPDETAELRAEVARIRGQLDVLVQVMRNDGEQEAEHGIPLGYDDPVAERVRARRRRRAACGLTVIRDGG